MPDITDHSDELLHSGADAPQTYEDSSTLSVVPGPAEPPEQLSHRALSRAVHTRRARHRLRTGDYVQGILEGDRVILGQAITLIESAKAEHNDTAVDILDQVLPYTGQSLRIGITGVPGVGKSTFIEALGTRITDEGHQLAVLAIDPSSQLSKGSIMGDKTRMERLSASDRAFIRPSPSAGSLGGVARKTREAMLLCEAAGYGVIFIETVGVGQSETMVHSMVDFFLLLMLAGAGDELQGIKRGIMEMADELVITKADGDNVTAALRARTEYENALHILPRRHPAWNPPVRTASALSGEGIDTVWEDMLQFQELLRADGSWDEKRRGQSLDWMQDLITQSLMDEFHAHVGVASCREGVEELVRAGALSPVTASRQLLRAFRHPDAESASSTSSEVTP